ncbi:MAG: glutaminyl-peptide cyclotransferase [Pseudomonadota bacterium]
MLTSLLFSLTMMAQTITTPIAFDVEVVNTFPHETDAFTQGLLFADGVLIESTGLEGFSRLRKIDMRTGAAWKQINLPDDVFGEGTALVGDQLVVLTYKAGQGFVFDLETLKQTAGFTYTGDGWGLTYDGERLIMSDGTSFLRFLDPNDYKEIGRLQVTISGRPLRLINELEYIDGQVWANIYGQDWIARIDPTTGVVTATADLSQLYPRSVRGNSVWNALNGIAYEENSDRLFVTGKNWPSLFEIKLTPVQ